MTSMSSDVHAAVIGVWDAPGLNSQFTQYWPASSVSEFPVLHDGEATPAQPMPYCVFSQGDVNVVSRMSGSGQGVGSANRQEIRDMSWEFKIHAKAAVVDGSAVSAKSVASSLANEVIKRFGGHPTELPTPLSLDNGFFLYSQYQYDIGMREEDDVYAWVIKYMFRVDVPVAS